MSVRTLAALSLALLTQPALAQVDPFELEVYPATTEGKGLHEIENTTTFVANGHEAPAHRA